MQRGVFISDLHLFSSRSDAKGPLEALRRYREECDCIVLGGDIFDLRWSQVGGLQPTIDAAQKWLEELLDRSGKSRVLYLAGNHDCHPEFAAAMQSFAAERERFAWFDHALQIQDCLFIHGDILHSEPTASGLSSYRGKHHHGDAPHPYLHHVYDLAVSLRLHKAVARLGNSPKATCRRLQDLLSPLPTRAELPVERVFFGHTHVSIPGLELGEHTFFNPGAMLKHMKNSPMHFELQR